MWDSNFTDEVFVAVKRFNLSWGELQQIARFSYERSFAEPALKQALLAGYAATWLALSGSLRRRTGRPYLPVFPQ